MIDLGLLINLAAFCFILSYVECIGTTKTLSIKNEDDSVDNNKELRALSLVNISSDIFQGFSVDGSLSRSTINDESG